MCRERSSRFFHTSTLGLCVTQDPRVRCPPQRVANVLLNCKLTFVSLWKDDTGYLVTSTFEKADVPGRLVHHAWVDFSTNRNECLREGRQFIERNPGICSYFVLMDADHVFKHDRPESQVLSQLTKDVYTIQERSHHHVYWMKRIVRAFVPFEYAGAVHEYLRHAESKPYTVEELPEVYLEHRPRWHLGNEKWLRDAKALENALALDPTDSRSHFYLGNTYSTLGRYKEAIHHWMTRIRLGGWKEEVFMSAYYIAQTLEKAFWHRQPLDTHSVDFLSSWLSFMNNATDLSVWSVIEAYNAASLILPYRREPMYDIGRLYRTVLQDYEGCYQYSHMAQTLKDSGRHTLFMAADVYLFRVEEQICICAYYTQRYCEGLKACEATVGKLKSAGNIEGHLTHAQASKMAL